MMIDQVLATDMAQHFKDIEVYKNRIEAPDFDYTQGNDKRLSLNMFVHVADISNTTKPWTVCQRWIDLLFVEFYAQGD